MSGKPPLRSVDASIRRRKPFSTQRRAAGPDPARGGASSRLTG
jgi:hypothetical protein